MSSLLIKNARYLGDSVDLLVVDGKVQSLSASINAPADAEIVDAAGKILFPSLIDVHTHLREPGYEWKETVATGLSSAAHGGFGAILCMANTDPVNDDAAVTEQILESARRSWPNGPRVHPIGRPPSASRVRNSPACPNSRMPDASPSPTTDAQ